MVPRVRFNLSFCIAMFGMALASGQPLESGPGITMRPNSASIAASLPRPTFRVGSNLIQVPVTVTDLRDRSVMDLTRNSFRAFEDGVEQQIATFSMTDGPVSTGIVFDASGSMRNHVNESRVAVGRFLQNSVPGDEFLLVRFSGDAELVTQWTWDADRISRALIRIHPNGWTAMIDGIRLALSQIRRASNARRSVLVLSDGGDNNSRYSEAELLSIARETDARVWAIGLFERPQYLRKLAEETGGRVVWVHKLAELPAAIDRVSREIRNQYVIGYFSNRAHDDGRYHNVRIEVQPPSGMRVRATWRRGYIAP